jgi:hypothetical protein
MRGELMTGTPAPGSLSGYQQTHSHRRWIRVGLCALAGFGTLIVLACGAQSPTPVSAPAEQKSATPSASQPQVAKVGAKELKYATGIAVAVSNLQRFTKSQYAPGGQPGDKAVKFTVKITNRSDQVFDLTLVQVVVKAGVNGTQADQIFDVQKGISSFQGSIAPGRSASQAFAFAVAPEDLGTINIEVTPTFDLGPAIFEGSVS